MARRRFGHRGARTLKNNVWTSVVGNEILVSSLGASELDIVTEADWAGGSPGQRATLLTIRGWLSICGQVDTATKVTGSVFWYIGLMDQDIAVGKGAQTADTYVDEDILTTGGHQFEAIPGTGTGSRNTFDVEINVKTKRTFNANTDVRFVLANRTGDGIEYTAVLRALLRKGGN